MKPKIITSERGQALVLLAFGIIALLGFAALAIDGGMVYADRRHAQNAADAASLAGGAAASQVAENYEITIEEFSCGNSHVTSAANNAVQAAISRANSNGFTIDGDISDKHGVTVECVDNLNNGFYVQKYLDIRVFITIETETTFAHFVYKGPLVNTVQAVTRIRPQSPLVYGQAIVGLNPAACDGNNNGVIIDGSSSININGGGVFSNGCLRANGNNLSVLVENGNVGYAGNFQNNTGPVNIQPTPAWVDTGPLPESSALLPPPDCSSLPNLSNQNGRYNGLIEPGRYNKVKLNGDAQLVGGGLYCIMNGDFDTGNYNLSIDESNGKIGVTIFLEVGKFLTSGGGDVDLKAPPYDPDPDPAIPGVLIYLAENNTSLVQLRGNSESTYYGIVYAPDGFIDAAGTIDHLATFNTQLIAKNVKVGGNAQIDINYAGADYYRKPTTLDLHQ